MRVCFIGDVVAAPGMRVVKNILPSIVSKNNIDFVIVNAENSCYGLGISERIILELFDLGVDVITLGNHTFSNKDYINICKKYRNVIRPANMAGWPGYDYSVITKGNNKLAVVSIMGKVNVSPTPDCPFTKIDNIVTRLHQEGIESIVVDFHAEATSEKTLMGYYLDGRVSLVAGTHTHVQTADDRILSGSTGYITDVGMCGAVDSVIGMSIDSSKRRLVHKLPSKYTPAEGVGMLCGVIADIDVSGFCTELRRICEYE